MELATWLQEHRESLVALCEQRGAADITLFDSVLEAARTGSVNQLDSTVKHTAHHSVAQEISLDRLLRKPLCLKESIWAELWEDALPASQILTLVEATEPIISHVFQVATRSYFEASQQMQDALASEIARLNSEAERRILDRTADLTRANVELSKLEQAKTDFISIAAHELKTPLTLIQGYTNMLHEMGLAGDIAGGTSHIVEGILRGADRLSAIVEDMLDVSVIDTDALSLRIEVVSVAQAVSLVVGQSANDIGERHLTVHVGDLDSLPQVEVDSRRLHQILSHLLNNAMKYTPDGGEISVEAGVLSGDFSEKHGPTGGNRFVELTVRDTGIGIAPEDRERVFEKFYRVGQSTLHSSSKVKFKGAGPGLGLPIARGLAEAHGGRLWVESPGHDDLNCPGSTFHLLLPVRAMPKPGITVTWVETPGEGQGEKQDI
jgi:signal transduction histidine kinase